MKALIFVHKKNRMFRCLRVGHPTPSRRFHPFILFRKNKGQVVDWIFASPRFPLRVAPPVLLRWKIKTPDMSCFRLRGSPTKKHLDMMLWVPLQWETCKILGSPPSFSRHPMSSAAFFRKPPITANQPIFHSFISLLGDAFIDLLHHLPWASTQTCHKIMYLRYKEKEKEKGRESLKKKRNTWIWNRGMWMCK